MKRFKPRFEKSRRSSEAHSIAIFKEKLKDFGLHHGKGKAELEKENLEVAIQALPELPHLHTLVYAVTCVLALVATSYSAYEPSRSVVSKQFKTISNSACRSTVHNIQSVLDQKFFLQSNWPKGWDDAKVWSRQRLATLKISI